MRDQGQILGRLGARYCELCGHLLHLAALGQKRRLQRSNVVRQSGKIGVHDQDKIINLGRWLLQNRPAQHYPALAGRQLWRGFRQSIPSSI